MPGSTKRWPSRPSASRPGSGAKLPAPKLAEMLRQALAAADDDERRCGIKRVVKRVVHFVVADFIDQKARIAAVK